jgi:hypothetical protein
MGAPAEIQPGALSHDRPCPICGHSAHWTRCGDDIGEGVVCPCHCPVPGIYD